MARGRDAHVARQQAIAKLGKNLTRRAGSACELCAEPGALLVSEVPPLPEEPAEDAAILSCERCRDLVSAKKLPKDTGDLRFLEQSAWSEHAPVQITAVRLLRRLGADTPWASECLDSLWLDDEIEARIAAS